MPCLLTCVYGWSAGGVFPLRKGRFKVDKDGRENVFEGEGRGEMEVDPCDPFTDSGSHFEEAVL